MKKILYIVILLLTYNSAFSQLLQSAPAKRNNNSDTYYLGADSLLRGGFRIVADSNERNAIPTTGGIRKYMMAVIQQSDSCIYTLNNPITSNNWKKWGKIGGSGVSFTTQSPLNLASGVLSIDSATLLSLVHSQINSLNTKKLNYTDTASAYRNMLHKYRNDTLFHDLNLKSSAFGISTINGDQLSYTDNSTHSTTAISASYVQVNNNNTGAYSQLLSDRLRFNQSGNNIDILPPTLTGNYTLTLPNKTDTLATKSDVRALVIDSTKYRTTANSFTKAQTNTQISNATANFVPLDKVNGWFDLGSAELFAGAAEIGGNKPGAYGAGVYNTSATGNGMFIKGGASGYHNTDFIDYNNNTVSYVLGTSTYTSADHLALTTKDYVDAAVNSAVSGIPAGVTSFNSRTGAVTPQSGDYSSFYPLLSGSYVNPSWIASIPWSKITGAPAQGSPSTANKSMAANNTTGDGQVACNTGIATTPINGGYVGVYVNGRLVNIGDGVKTSDAYFSGDGGTTARPLNGVQAGDLLYWNGSIAGFQLTTTDSISFLYI